MNPYWIEGLYVTKRGLAKAKKAGNIAPADIEPFGRVIWAMNPEDALRLATQELKGGQWTDGPKVSKTTEEQRMRTLGAPQLSGFGAPQPRRKKAGR